MIYVLGHRDNFHSLEMQPECGGVFHRKSLVKDFSSIDVEVRDPVERRQFGDMTFWVNAPVFSQRAIDVLGPALKEGCEKIPLRCHGEELYAINVLKETKEFNSEESILRTLPDGRLMDVKEYAFFGCDNEQPDIFRIPGLYNQKYVNQSFVDVVRSHRLKGFSFQEVWPVNRYRPLSRERDYSFHELINEDADGVLEDDFDSELWFLLIEKIDTVSDLRKFPHQVQVYYASRLMEWEVANGGFAQAAMNIPEWFSPAASAYRELGKQDCADLILEAQSAARKDWIKIILSKFSIETAFSYFSEKKFSGLEEKLDEVGWWSDWDRVDYVRRHRDVFSTLD